jgi:hypothetical protein
MAKGKLTKDRQYHGQRETFFVSFSWAMILSVFCQVLFGHDIVCLFSISLWPWYCLSFVSFPLPMILSVFCQFPFGHDIKGKLTKDKQYHGRRETDK